MLVKNRGYIRKLRVRKEAPSPKKPVQSQKSAGSQKKVKLIVPDKEKGTDKATASNSQADDKPKGIFMKTHVPRKYMPHVAPVYTKRVVHFSREAHDCREHLIDKAASSKRFGIYQEFTSEWNKFLLQHPLRTKNTSSAHREIYLRNFMSVYSEAICGFFRKPFLQHIQILMIKRMIDPEFAGELHSELARLISNRSPKSPISGTRGRKRKGLRKNSNENDEGENKQKCGILETILGSPDKSGGKSPIKPFASRIISLFTGL
ncbi:hypothetical protein WR25_04381 [Diploscapter pachys]|uniref:Uncharacterized protein n=1 Tax=Diploscapter pachys TaxID=2018661 RepID=A0A2A2JHG0_9BILA|nr:hypothetical protein WR25_04381 [Diploscapter pachys]